MTPEEFTKNLPPLTDNPLLIQPPFLFNGMSARIFTLRANLDTLQQLCDGYLNFVPPEAGRFRAFVPYVQLMVLDYGQVAESLARIGWFAQTEVFFSVPVEWYQLVNGKWVFHDWAVITPYIFVNDQFSVPLGRTVYGFPKVLAKVTCAPSGWISDPLSPATLARVETTVFPESYTGMKLESRVFLEVDREAPMSNFRMPFDPRSPIAPWIVASNFADAIGGFGRDAMWLAQAMRIYPINPGSNPGFLPEMLARLAPSFAPGGQGFLQNSINLKQFRHSNDPTDICYQALTNGRMQTTSFNGGGLLGEERTFWGDLTGGHTIRLHEYGSLPIVRTLGLEVHRKWRGEGGVDVAELKPLLPFWINLDVKYERGDNLAWRTLDGIWRDGGGNPFDPAQKPAVPQYNDSVASAIEAITGPFQFTGTTIRVLPLLAKKKHLQEFLDGYINRPLESPIRREDGTGKERVRLSVWARPPTQVNLGEPMGGNFAYVYMTASSFGSVASKTNNVGDWAKYELAFNIPVKFEREGPDGTWNLEGVGMVPAYTFTDNCIATISRFEIQGINATTTNFVIPESVWLKEGEPSVESRQPLLRVDAEVWPAYGAGQKAVMEPLIEISKRDPDAGLGETNSWDKPYQWAEDLRLELGTKKGAKSAHRSECKIARALALELLGNQTPFALYTLKQFRDVEDPSRACYQSLVRVPRVLSEVFDVREIEETLVVRISDFPNLEIAETLGIVAPRVPDGGSGLVYSAQAIRPFYICATVDEPPALRLLDRARTLTWSLTNDAFKTLLSDEPGSPEIAADGLAERLQDQIDPSRMTAIMYHARARLEGRRGDSPQSDWYGLGPISKADAREALGLVDPQFVIESVLSREWGNTNPNARWRRGRQELVDAYGTLPLSGPAKADAETVLYEAANNHMAIRPGSVANMPGMASAVKSIIQRQQEFTEARLTMESCFDVLAPWTILGMGTLEKKLGKEVPTLEQLAAAGTKLVEAIAAIYKLQVAGEPSERNNLDTQVLADHIRLGQLLDSINVLLAPLQSAEDKLAVAVANAGEFREALELARKFCDAQFDAMLNKLSRTYQKPDFCIHRDSVGTRHDRLLPVTLSWDEKWYYGKNI